MKGNTKQRPSAFVIMPFANEYFWLYEDIIKPPLIKLGMDVDRTDTQHHLELITKRIMEQIISAKLVVSVINNLNPQGINPNVMYELGVCHTFKIPTLLLVEDMNRIPFDIKQLVAYQYPDKNSKDYFNARNKLHIAIESIASRILSEEIKTGNPVTSLIPNVFDYLAPVDWFDKLQYSVEEIENTRKLVFSISEKICAIENRVESLSSPSDTFWGWVKWNLDSVILSIIGGILIKDLTERLIVLNNYLERVSAAINGCISNSIQMLEYNQKLYEARKGSTACKESAKIIVDTISRVIESAKLTLDTLENHPLSDFFPKMIRMIGSLYAGILFDSVLMDEKLSTHCARETLSEIALKGNRISVCKDKIPPIISRIDDKLSSN